jgi:hypothetical protein
MAVQYLVPDGQHLPYTDESGKPSHRLMGAAWAALHGGYRGNKYEGPGKEEAIAKLKEIYKKEGMETPASKAAAGSVKRLFGPIFKVRDTSDGMFVEGCLAAEEEDFEHEIMDYKTSKPLFQKWSEDVAQKSGGLSVGNLRGQHNPKILAGKFVEINYDDESKKINVVAKVIDPTEQDKVREGCYTSFSTGAQYAKKWRDGNLTRWTAAPFEGSLVDIGSMPSTRGFVYCAADGKEEQRSFDGGRRELREAFEGIKQPLTTAEEDRIVETVNKSAAAHKGLWTVSAFANLMSDLIGLRNAVAFERSQEGDDSPVTDRIADATEELLECLASYTQEQVSEEISNNEENKFMAIDISEAKKKLDQARADLLKAEESFKAAGGKEECMKSEADCDDDNCPKHGEAAKKRKKEKAAAAAAGSEVAMKRADVESLIATKFADFEGVIKTFGTQLGELGETVKLIASQPVASNVAANRFAQVSKAKEGGAGGEESVDELAEKAAKNGGSMRDAIIRARQEPNFVGR